MKKFLLLATTAILLFTSCDLNLSPQERQARATVKTHFKQMREGDSYKPIAWGRVEFNSHYAGTGTKEFIDIKKTGTPPSKYSITHRLRMRNGLGSS